jgi:hypothetical protein
MPYFPPSIIQDFMQQYIAGEIPAPTAHNFLYSIWDSDNEIQYGANYRRIYDDPEKFSMLNDLGLNDITTRGSAMLTALALYFINP